MSNICADILVDDDNMKDQGPRVGIVIPVYNRRNDLAALLKSLSGLNYRNFDVLVVDNGSDDDVRLLQHEVDFELLAFSENLGAIRGFNEGARHLVSRGVYQYIWLLDSDLTVHADALGHSVRIMEADKNIGICVSIIYNIFDKDIVVEAGGMIDLKHGLVSARFGNERRRPLPETEDVDYASCGMSLLRVAMIEKIGLYDERYHFLWEDMDYGLYASKNGWRVVVSSQSELYHPPFTEKRNPNIYAYFGVRNPLLTVARHTSGLLLPYYLFCNLIRYIRIAFLVMFSGVDGFAKLTFKGIGDFISGHLGRAELEEITSIAFTEEKAVLSHGKRIHVIGTGSYDVVEAALSALKVDSSTDIVLVVQRYRAELFGNSGFSKIITYDDYSTNALLEYIRTGLVILLNGGCVINTDLKVTSPLVYFSSKAYNWDNEKNRFYRSGLNFFALWQPLVAVILGVLGAIFFLPMVYLAALIHRRKKPVIP